MKYITRWALMRCMRQESLSEHTADTALLAHALCLIARNITHTGADIRPDTVAAAALYHDAPEILTGDMPPRSNTRTKPCAPPTKPWNGKAPLPWRICCRRSCVRSKAAT